MWDVLTWWWGLPTSSSHALIGGYAGAAMARAAILHGWSAAPHVIIASGWTKTLIFIVLAPLMGFAIGFGLMVAVSWIFRKKSPRQVDTLFRRLQLLSAAAYSLGHGGNDAKTGGQRCRCPVYRRRNDQERFRVLGTIALALIRAQRRLEPTSAAGGLVHHGLES